MARIMKSNKEPVEQHYDQIRWAIAKEIEDQALTFPLDRGAVRVSWQVNRNEGEEWKWVYRDWADAERDLKDGKITQKEFGAKVLDVKDSPPVYVYDLVLWVEHLEMPKVPKTDMFGVDDGSCRG